MRGHRGGHCGPGTAPAALRPGDRAPAQQARHRVEQPRRLDDDRDDPHRGVGPLRDLLPPDLHQAGVQPQRRPARAGDGGGTGRRVVRRAARRLRRRPARPQARVHPDDGPVHRPGRGAGLLAEHLGPDRHPVPHRHPARQRRRQRLRLHHGVDVEGRPRDDGVALAVHVRPR